MYSHSQIDISMENHDVIGVENFTEANWTPNNVNIWQNKVAPDPNQNYQNTQWIQQTNGLHCNTQQSSVEQSEDFQRLLEDIPPVPPTINYQNPNPYYTSRHYFNNHGNVPAQNMVQVPTSLQMGPCHQMGNRFDNTYHKIDPHTNGVQPKNLKAIKKRKRKRTMFTTEQVAVLEKVFLSKPYVNREERQALVEELQINDRVIKVWFQNRRLKEKREAEEAEQEFYAPDTEGTEARNPSDELSYVESQINRTDKFGFVTLDDRAMNGLVSVIDNLFKETPLNLPEERQVDVSPNKQQEESEGSTIYEPISPASSECTSSEASTSYEPFEPKESLQRIFDIQEFLVFNKKTV